MSSAHAHAHGRPVGGEGPLTAVAAHCKLVGVLVFVAAVVATPKEQWWVFVVDALVVVAVASYARIPLGALARRLTIELPFVAFALLMPIVGRAPRVDVLGIPLSQPGLWAAWGIVAKGTLGVAASAVLAATTPVPELVGALDRLRVPAVLTSIFSFLVRYGDVVTDEMRRMRVARVSRGDSARWLWQARATATSAGALFVRSYERGERVYLAMQARGFDGRLPQVDPHRRVTRWTLCLSPGLVAAALAAMAWYAR